MVGESVNAELIGGVIAALLSVVGTTIVLLIILCLCCRYHRTAKMSVKKIDQ